MGNLTNPKTLKGQDKVNRIKDLMGRMNTLTESKSFSELELIKKGPNDIVYGIIRENHDYFIKTTEKKSGTFLAEDFNYIGGLQNKYDERYGTYAETIKQLNMKFDMLNEYFGVKNNTNIFESDGVQVGNASGMASGVAGMGFVMEEEDEDHDHDCEKEHPGDTHKDWESKEELIMDDDEKSLEEKTVLNVDVPAPAPAPVEDEVEVDEFAIDDEGGEEDFEDEEEDFEGGEEEGDETTKKIQKLTGKVAQLMRDMDEPDAELDKYVINSVISAIDFEVMDDEDVEDIIAKIEGEDEEDGEGVDEFGGEEVDVDLDAEEVPESEPTEEITEDSEGEETYNYGEDEGKDEEELKKLEKKKQTKDTKSHEKALGKDEEFDEDKEDRKEKGTKFSKQKNESRTFSKKQLMETFLNKNVKNSLKKVLKENRAICEECLGEGCSSCMNEHHPMDASKRIGGKYDRIDYFLSEDIEEFDRFEDFESSPYYEGNKWDIRDRTYFDKYREKYGAFRVKPWQDSYAGTFGPDDNDLPWLDRRNDRITEVIDDIDTEVLDQDVLYSTGDLDRDSDDIPNRLDLDNDDDGSLDFGMGNKMYDWPERIFGRKGDRDSDGIPNLEDSDIDGDGMNDDFIELDFDSIMGDGTETAEPDVTPSPHYPPTKPGTTPGTTPGKPGWKKIPRPRVIPKPKAMDRRRASARRSGIYR